MEIEEGEREESGGEWERGWERKRSVCDRVK